MSENAWSNVIAIVMIVAVIFVAVFAANWVQRNKCESLKAQGVSVYVADKGLTVECVVIREEPRK